MKLLLVEDDRALCETVKLQLEQAGYQTDVCHLGRDAFYFAAERCV